MIPNIKSNDRFINYDSFCLAPWTHAYSTSSGERRLCCVSEKIFIDDAQNDLSLQDYWNSNEVKKVRKQMLKGEKISACKSCHLGEIGGNVLRNHYNSAFRNHIKDVLLNTETDGHYEPQPVSYDYRSATCNFKCRMCDPGNSTSWRTELTANNLNEGPYPKNVENSIYEELLAAATSGNLEEIYWAGGEPLILAKHWQVMDQLVQSKKSKDINVRYNTNLSHIEFRSKKFLDVVENFKMTTVYLSLDGIGPIGEYLRTGLKWNTWLENFEYLMKNKSEKISLVIDSTLTLPGLMVVEDFLQFFNGYNIEVSAKPVLTQAKDIYISPQALPNEIYFDFIKEKIASIRPYQSHFNTGFFRAMNTYLKMDTFQDQYKDNYHQTLYISKKWANKLDDIRVNQRQVSISDIYRLNTKVGKWWESITTFS